MSKKAAFFVSVGGIDVTGSFSPSTTSITVTDSSGSSSDTASITVDDTDGQIAFPAIGDPMTIGLGWGAPVVIFDGFVDDVTSTGSRSGGMTLAISAKSADTVKGKAKEQAEKHKDDATLGDVAAEWGQAAGLQVQVASELASIKRKYWSMNNESFAAWGERMARELGATFKIVGTRAVMVPRGAGMSASGQPLVPFVAQRGVNLFSWSIKPAIGRPQHKEVRTRYYETAKGEWVEEKEASGTETQAEAVMTTRFTETDKDSAKTKSKAKAKENDRDKGGGSAEVDGDPSAQAEATCIIIGARPGVDGPYRIDSVTHNYSRGGGFTTSLTLKEPGSGTGQDDR